MAASPLPVDLPWSRLFDELRELEQTRRPAVASISIAPRVAEKPQNLPAGDLPTILRQAADALTGTLTRAASLEEEVAAARAAYESLEKTAREMISNLEIRAQTAEDRVQALEARFEKVRKALGDALPVEPPLAPRRANPAVKGPQPMFAPVDEEPAPPTAAEDWESLAEDDLASEDGYDDLCEAVRRTLLD